MSSTEGADREQLTLRQRLRSIVPGSNVTRVAKTQPKPQESAATPSTSSEPNFPPLVEDPLRWVGFAIIFIGTLVLFWKLHGFKLPSEIERERINFQNAQPGAVPKNYPAPSLFRALTDWLTPWRWGRGSLLTKATATGGDMGAHVWAPDFVRRSLFEKGRLTGWSMDWFGGMPILNFYFPLPSLTIAALGYIIAPQTAFKLVTVLGLLLMPTTAWGAGKLTGLRRPIPVAMGLAGMTFVLGRHYNNQIYGGNALSTMAGEFSFAISISLAVLFLGLFSHVLKTGKRRAPAALVLAATGLSHLLPTIWVLVSCVILLLTHLDVSRLRLKNSLTFFGLLGGGFLALIILDLAGQPAVGVLVLGLVVIGIAMADQLRGTFGIRQLSDAATVLGFGGAIAGFWLLPFAHNLPYTNDMGWEKEKRYVANLFPFWDQLPGDNRRDRQIVAVAMILAAVGALSAFLSFGRALLRAVESRSNWNGQLLSVASVVGTALGALVWLAQHNFFLGVGVFCAVITMALLAGVAISETNEARRWLFAVAAVAPVLITLAHSLFPEKVTYLVMIIATGLTIVGVLLLGASMQLDYEKWAMSLTLVIGICAALYVQAPQFRLWNQRVLPFWFLSIFLLAAYGAVRLVNGIVGGISLVATPKRTWPGAPIWGTVAMAAIVFVGLGLPLGLVPSGLPIPKVSKGLIGIQKAGESNDRSDVPGWSGYNFEGYEGRSAWPEYRALMDEAVRVGKTNGCGRSMWEHEEVRFGGYGTTLSLMLIPYWTQGCIGSMDGVYFESSATAPMHWLNSALVSAPNEKNADGSAKFSGPTNPQRNLPYSGFDLARGIQKLRIAGVRYYIAVTPLAIDAANAMPQELKQVGQSGPYRFYELIGNEMVGPIDEEPVVVKGIEQHQDGGWLDVEVDQYNNPDRYPKWIAWSGPKEWQRTTAAVNRLPTVVTYGSGVTVTPTERKPLPKVVVSKVSYDNVNIRFHVDRVGVPVLVKTSYFPNWKVEGGKGPYRVMPNFMLVIPTKNDVVVHYGYSPSDILGHLATLSGLIGVVWLHRTRRRVDDVLDSPYTSGAPGTEPDRTDDPNNDESEPSEARRSVDHALVEAVSVGQEKSAVTGEL